MLRKLSGLSFIPRKGESLSDRETRKSNNRRPRLNALRLWINWYCVPTSYWQRQFRALGDIHSDDGGTWSRELNHALTWTAYRVAIIYISVAGTTYGIGQLIVKILGS